MSNPLFEAMGTNTNGIGQLIQQFEQFKKSFNGNPKEQVQQLLNSGKVSQEQYNRAVQMANQLQKYIK